MKGCVLLAMVDRLKMEDAQDTVHLIVAKVDLRVFLLESFSRDAA